MRRNTISSDAAIRAIKPGDPRKRLSDGDGLFLLLFASSGLHGWRFDYRFGGKRKMLSFGVYPDTSLALARRKADEARRLLAEGINPSDQRKAAKAAQVETEEAEAREAQGLPPVNSFEAVAREWFDVKQGGWAPGYSEKIIARLENDIFPWIGRAPINSITPPHCSRCCAGSRAAASSRRRTERSKTAARSFATQWPSERTPTTRRGI